MSIYTNYPTIQYKFDIGSKIIYKDVTDITANVRIDKKDLNSIIDYQYQVINDGESPEITSYKNYDNCDYYYLLMLANDNYDWKESYPLTASEFESFIKEKYTNPYGIHHYEDIKGNIVDNIGDDSGEFSFPKNVIPVTNYEYEQRINESKRNVKIINKNVVANVNDACISALKE